MIIPSFLGHHRFCLAAAALCFAPVLHASPSELTPKITALPALETAQRVVVAKTLRRGKDTHVYKWVTPPAKPAAVLLPVTTATPVEGDGAAATDEEAEEPVENRVSFSCSILTHPFGVAEIQWSDSEGREKRVFAHDDLSYLRMSFPVKFGETTYDYTTLNYGPPLGEAEPLSAYPVAMQEYVRRARRMAKGDFVAVPATTGRTHPLSEEERDALDVLLAYYQINREPLRLEHEAAEARWKIETEARRIRDLTPQTYELRFWPVISQRHASASQP